MNEQKWNITEYVNQHHCFFESIKYFYFDFFSLSQFKAFKLIAINFVYFYLLVKDF